MQNVTRFLWGSGTLWLVAGAGLYITWRVRFIQLRGIGRALRALSERDPNAGGETGAFGALCTSLGATIGTGNIIGVAIALSEGGAGVIFWMAVAALLAMGMHYAEGFFAVKYRKRDATGTFFGGPFLYISKGICDIAGKRMAKIYAVALALCGICGVGTLIQSGGIYAAAKDYFHFTQNGCMKWVIAVAVTVVGGGIIFGGLRRISRVAEILVPVMSLLYVGSLLWIICTNLSALPQAVGEILQSALSPGAMTVGGIWGAVQVGIKRSVLSNEAGLGTAAVAAAVAKTDSPHKQGLVTMTASLIDTLIMCSVTGLVLVVTGAHNSGAFGVEMTMRAFATGLPLAPAVSRAIVTLSLILFAFSTIISWNYYGESALRFLKGTPRALKIYRALYLCGVFLGPFLSLSAAFCVADIGNAILLCCHLPALVALCSKKK